jgi:hypothetical protein
MLCCAVLAGQASAARALERINSTNSSLGWQFASGSNAVDATPSGDSDCPQQDLRDYFSCSTEFNYQQPNGRSGSRWFLNEGFVKWTGVRVNPYGPGDLGTPHSYKYTPSTWIRRWHPNASRCLHTWRIHGVVQSNFPCAAYEIWHGASKEGFNDEPGPGWPWISDYRCVTRRRWTTCQNAEGDAYRYRGAYPSMLNGTSGSISGETAHPCENHAGKMEGDGQYSDGATYTLSVLAAQPRCRSSARDTATLARTRPGTHSHSAASRATRS